MYYFIGIKGSGMASLASILKDRGEEVSGSDIDTFIFTQKKLEEHQIPFFAFSETNIKDHMNVIIGSAFDDSNIEVQEAKKNPTVTTYSYAEFLGHLMSEYHSISISGTHGKTTTTGMLAHVFADVNPTGYLIGDGTGKMVKNAKTFVVESCEYHRRFLAYYPDYAIILNMELDHVDYYRDLKDYLAAFQSFSNNVKKGIAIFGDEENAHKLNLTTPHLFYGEQDGNNVQALHVVEDSKGVSFDCHYNGKFYHHFQLPFYGKHLLWNALGVITIGIMNELDSDLIERNLQTFTGVERRFNIEEVGDNVYIDDYAHHPTAIQLTIEACKQKYPNKKIVAIFQPDRYSRIHYFLSKFNDAFQEADEVFLCPFPKNAVKEVGIDIDINDLAAAIKGSQICEQNSSGVARLAHMEPAVYLFMSSKDIYKFKDMLKTFQNN